MNKIILGLIIGFIISFGMSIYLIIDKQPYLIYSKIEEKKQSEKLLCHSYWRWERLTESREIGMFTFCLSNYYFPSKILH